MCGIFGIIDSNECIDILKLQKISKTLSHRGPDDEGFLLGIVANKFYKPFKGDNSPDAVQLPHISTSNLSFNFALLHRRLSIIDLSSLGHQPMNYDDRYWIVLNGEIYNYKEIRETLITKGYDFHSETDTEVVLVAFVEWGENCVNLFNGMWAFAIWDNKENSLFISRDRFGVKPLYYYYKNEKLIFCSEIKGIREYYSNINIRQDAITDYLQFGEFRTGKNDNTFFEGVKQLEPGQNFVFRNKNIRTSKYWNLEIKLISNSIANIIGDFKELFYDSIKLRLRSDVEVGACLSGGLDSSSIVSYASSKFDKQFHTFSIIWPGEQCDESEYIRYVNEKYDTFSHSFMPDLSNVLEVIDKVIWHQELPIPTGSILAQWFVMEKAKNTDIKVLLDGQGADEVLAGYPRFIKSFINEMLLKGNPHPMINNYALLRQYKYSAKSFSAILRDLAKYKFFRQLGERNFISLSEHQKDELEVNCIPTLLHYEDRNSMAHSVESRLPFLDYRLVEFLFTISSEQKIRNSRMKYILVESMQDFLPEPVYLRRDKIGFETPIEKYLELNKQYYNYDWKKDKLIEEYMVNNPFQRFNYQNKKFKIYSLSRFLSLFS
jgi:asparagine synthase (glutamine-hydrolysing)